MPQRKVRTTVALAADLLEAVDAAVREGEVSSRNDFLEAAVRHEIVARRRATIDAAFADMAGDAAYQREAEEVAAESAPAGWEALRLAEGGS
jgi:metal-responsive CopG/Arc/MetJ family transcriptional regulator